METVSNFLGTWTGSVMLPRICACHIFRIMPVYMQIMFFDQYWVSFCGRAKRYELETQQLSRASGGLLPDAPLWYTSLPQLLSDKTLVASSRLFGTFIKNLLFIFFCGRSFFKRSLSFLKIKQVNNFILEIYTVWTTHHLPKWITSWSLSKKIA